MPIAAAVSRKSTTPSSLAPGNETGVVMQHRRDDAGGTVGRRRHHAPAGCVFLVDRQRPQVDPVERHQRIAHAVAVLRAGVAHSAARRLTFSPPGNMPSVTSPRATQRCITCQISQQTSVDLRRRCASAARWCASPARSTADARPALREQVLAAVETACGSTVVSGAMRRCAVPSAATSSLTTNPPPTE